MYSHFLEKIFHLKIFELRNTFYFGYTKGYKVIVRPHPQHVKHMKEKFDSMKELYKERMTDRINDAIDGIELVSSLIDN